MFWQATVFSAANSAMAFYALSLGRPGAAVVCLVAAFLGVVGASLMKKRPSRRLLDW